MDLSHIYLVQNFTTYNFEDVVFLAADINAIVEALMQPIVLTDTEKLLFLGMVLKSVLDICRTIVCNYSTLEELLKVNWSTLDDEAQKWQFFENLTREDPVHVIAKRILLSKEGERSLGIMQEFYRQHCSKEAFKEVLTSVQKSIPSIAPLCAFQALRQKIAGMDTTDATTLHPKEANIVALTNHTNSNDFTKLVENLQATLDGSDNEEMLKAQMRALKSLFTDAKLMERYREALQRDSYYQLNLAVLKFYHDHLLTKNILYDTNIIMLLYLLRQNGAHDALLREEFFNETRLGGPERMRILQLELQNFS